MRIRLALILLFWFPAAGSQTGVAVDRETVDAIDGALRALTAAPDSESARVSLASLYLKAGQNQTAIQTLRPYLQSHPDAPKALRLLAVAYLRNDEYLEAKDAAEGALRFGTRDSATVEVLAMAHLGLRADGAAMALFQEAVKLDPNSMEANLQLGLLYTKQHQNLGEAIRLLKKARVLQPNLAGTQAALGSAFLASGDPRQAADALETAVRLDPDIAEPYYLLGTAYRQLHDDGKADAALAAFQSRKKAEADQRALEMRSRADYEAGVNLLSNTDQLDKAYELLAKAVSERPTFDPGYYRMAQVSYLKGDLRSALASVREALRLNPLEPEYYYVLARCLEDTDPGAALDAIERAVGLRPGVPDFEDLRKELRIKAAGKAPA
jgi:tetratricopeptide (TPR) repeat protein